MSMDFEIGKTYEFEAIEIRQLESGSDYIALRYGEKDTYRVYNILKYQYEELPEKISAIVTKLDEFGLPRLRQDEAAIYRDLYQFGNEYTFKVKDIQTDYQSPTKAQYYVIEDELCVHRYYKSGGQQHQIGDDCVLVVKGVNDKGFLLFEEVGAEKKKAKQEKLVKETPEAAQSVDDNGPVLDIGDEDQHLELKTSIVFGGDGKVDVENQTWRIVRELAAFMNTDGGKLYIGVHDKTHVIKGIQGDYGHLNDNEKDERVYKEDHDGYQNLIRCRLQGLCQGVAQQLVSFEFPVEQGREYCVITVQKSHRPIWVKGNQLFIRSGNRCTQLYGDDISFFIANYDVFDNGGGKLDQIDLETAMRNVLNRDFATVSPAAEADDVAYYLSWYDDCSYCKRREKETGDNVLFSLPVHKSVRDGVVLFCYDNGCVNKVELRDLMSGMKLNKPKNRAFFTKANLVSIFVSSPTSILAVLSTDENGIQNVKAHLVAHINATKGGGNQGSTFVKQPCTNLKYKLVEAAHQSRIAKLILPKNQTTSEKGYPVTSPTYKAEIDYLMSI